MNLPLDSKIWIFQSQRNFSAEEIVEIEQILDNFMKEWNAHGASLTSAYAIPYDRFIVIAVDENKAQASGCSIDSMTRIIKTLEEKHHPPSYFGDDRYTYSPYLSHEPVRRFGHLGD